MLSTGEIKSRATEWALSVGLTAEEAKSYASDYITVRGLEEAQAHWATAEEGE
jgi:hypothetical protein